MAFNVGQAVGYLMLDTSGWQRGFTTAQTALKTFQDQTSTAMDKLGAVGSSMTSIGTAMTVGVTTPLLGAAAAAVSVGNEFEAQMSRVQAISGATGDELEQLTDQAMELGAQTSFSASQAAEGMENLASAGFTVNEIMDAMPGLLDLAASSGADLATASSIAAAAVRGFGLEASDTTHVADVFAEAAARTNAQVEGMGEAMKYIAPVANAMGQEIEMVAAAVGMMSDAGIMGSQAGTSLRGALSRLARPTDTMVEVMNEFGLSFYDASGNMLSLVGIVQQLEENLGGLTMEQRNNALVTLFGQESLSGMLALMDRGSDELQAMTDAFKDVDGAASDMAEIMLDNTAGAIEEMSGSVETFAIRLQQVLAPTVQTIVGYITDFVNWLNSLDDSTLRIITTVAGVVAALGPLLIIFGTLASSIANISGLIAGAGGLTGALTALTGPVGIAIAAVVALAAAFATNFGGIRDQAQEIFTAIGTIVSAFVDLISTLWEENFLGIQSITTAVFTAIEDIFGSALEVISSVFNVFAAAFSGDWEDLWEALKDLVDSVLGLISSILSNGLNLLVNIIMGIGSTFFSAAEAAFNFIYEAFSGVWNNIVSWFSGVIEEPVEIIKGIGTDLFEAGKSIFTSLWDGVKDIWNSISSWVEEKVNWLIDTVTFWDNEASRVGASSVSSGVDGSYASGLDYVPRDMNVRVHEGESILTKQQTAELANLLSGMGNNSSGDLVINWYMNGVNFSRAIIEDFRNVDTSTPKVVNDT